MYRDIVPVTVDRICPTVAAATMLQLVSVVCVYRMHIITVHSLFVLHTWTLSYASGTTLHSYILYMHE